MKSSRDKDLLKAYVHHLIKEYDGSMGFDSGGMGPVYGTKSDLFKTFIKPFTDVVGTVAGKTKELARRGITLAQTAFVTIMTTLIPFLTDSYEEIFAEQSRAIEKIRSEYQQYIDSTNKALEGDAAMLAFIAFPGASLTGKLASLAPQTAVGLLGIATGGISDEILGGGGGPRSSGIFDSYARSYRKLMIEQEAKESPTLLDKLQSKKFVSKLLSRSPQVHDVAKQAREIYKKTLNDAVEEARMVLSAKSLEEVEKIVGKNIHNVKELQSLAPDDRKKEEEEILKKMKLSTKKLYVERLLKEVDPVRKIFGEEHPFVVDYMEAINKIRAF
jgi:hypothetical protein